jgi:hypothetical protein
MASDELPCCLPHCMQVNKQFFGVLEKRLASACATALDEIEADVDTMLQQHLRQARRELLAAAPMVGHTTSLAAEGHERDVAVRHAIELGLLASLRQALNRQARIDGGEDGEGSEGEGALRPRAGGSGAKSERPTTALPMPTTALALPTTALALPTTALELPTTALALPTTALELPTRLESDFKLVEALQPHSLRLERVLTRALEATETRALQRQRSTVAEAWLQCEALRSIDLAAVRREAALATHAQQMQVRRDDTRDCPRDCPIDSRAAEAIPLESPSPRHRQSILTA